MQRGEIWDADIQNPAGEKPGHEQIGARPAVIIQQFITNQETVVVVPLTKILSNPFAINSFVVQPSLENGLALPSLVMTNHLRPVSVKKLVKRRGRLEAKHMQQLEKELRSLLNL